MSVAAVARRTPAELLDHPDDGQVYELVDGELLELNMSGESSWIAGRILRRMGASGEDSGVGWLFPVDAGFRCFPDDPEAIRKPDVAFIRRERLSSPPAEGFIEVAPDLAVEVVSPHDRAYEVEARVDLWLQAGCEEVWVVMPRGRTVTVHRRDGGPRVLTAEATISLPALIPGFSARVDDFFPPLAETPALLTQ